MKKPINSFTFFPPSHQKHHNTRVICVLCAWHLTWQWKWGKGRMSLQMPMMKSEGKAGGQEEAVQGAHQLLPDLQAQRVPSQVGEDVVVAGAEQQHLGSGCGPILKTSTS